MIASLTALDGTLVRPRWQPESVNIPQSGTVWCAFGFVDEASDFSPAQIPFLDNTGVGYVQLQENEEFGVLCSFYGTGAGSAAKAAAKQLRDGLRISQNREVLTNAGMDLLDVTAPVPAPTLTKEIWLYRCDLTLKIRRMITRDYPILSIETATVPVVAQTPDELDVNITVQP